LRRIAPTLKEDGRGTPRTRFTTQIVEACDLAGYTVLPIAVTRYALQILFHNEVRDNTSSLKLAELVRGSTGGYQLREAYVPPLLRMGGSRHLCALMQNLLALVTGRQQHLTSTRRQRSASMVDFKPEDFRRFMFLQHLNTMFGEMSMLAEEPDLHPLHAYRILRALVGGMCSFDAELGPTMLPAYDHGSPGQGFERAVEMARILLQRLVAERHTAIPLQQRQGGYYTAHLRDPALFRQKFYLGVTTTQTQNLRELPKLIKVAAEPQIVQVVQSASSGLAVRTVQYPPGALPIRPDTVFFELEQQGQLWQAVMTTGTLCFYHPDATTPDALTFALYAIDGDSVQ
jgi:type VI secretion system protein ImpJ